MIHVRCCKEIMHAKCLRIVQMKGEQIKKLKQNIKALVKTETGSIAD